MLGWGSTNQGLAVNIPDDIDVGSSAPLSNPRSSKPQQEEMTLKEKKELEKAARKQALKEKRALKKEQKEAKE
jgi:hypothetical protein